MTGRNIKIKGHALRKYDRDHPYKWWCYCGAWGEIFPKTGQTLREATRDGHDEHKENVLRKRGEWEEDDAQG